MAELFFECLSGAVEGNLHIAFRDFHRRCHFLVTVSIDVAQLQGGALFLRQHFKRASHPSESLISF